MNDTEHYFSKVSKTPYKPKEITVQLAGEDRKVTTASGVFSPDDIDRGTKVLLSKLPKASSGNILDIGCGWGAISLHTALETTDCTVWAVDVNERAKKLTTLNATNLGLKNVKVSSPDEVPEDLFFDEIRSNPPIRIGKKELHSILETWMPRLAPGGVAYLVVAKSLGANSLQKWLGEKWPDFGVSLFAREKGFHIIKVQN